MYLINIVRFTVGNIPYEATEEKLKEIFSEVGPVLSLKYVEQIEILTYFHFLFIFIKQFTFG